MTQPATRADAAAAYVRLKVFERGWTHEIEDTAMQYVDRALLGWNVYGGPDANGNYYFSHFIPRYPEDMGEIAFEQAVTVPVIHNWLTPAARGWTRFMYGRRGFWFAFGWLFWLMLAWDGVKVLLYFGVLAVMLALFVLSVVFDLATYPLRKR